MSKVYGIIAIKGGVGKTTSVANLGASLVKDYGKKVLLVDGNFSAPNLGLSLGIVHPKKNVHGVIHHKHSLDDAVHKHELGFDVLPSSLTSNRNIEPRHFKGMINYLRIQ